MRPYFGPFVDGPEPPPPEIVEYANTAYPIFGFLAPNGRYLDGNWPRLCSDEEKRLRIEQLSKRAREAWDWAVANSVGEYHVMVNDLPNYLKIRFLEPRDAVLFKLFWL